MCGLYRWGLPPPMHTESLISLSQLVIRVSTACGLGHRAAKVWLLLNSKKPRFGRGRIVLQASCQKMASELICN